ncbi:MAG: thioredoxin domain-containing protein [Gemmatimonadetes bacterium]|nr:thioredoxin domain-containing protein [Gemmatimonadota bacterium]
MPDSFRFSPRPNRAGEIHWRRWGRAAFDEASRTDTPILLNLTAVWCQWCHRMDETTYSDPALVQLINQDLIPMRVDADHNPHVQDRYIAGGWPTNAFLTPTGEVLWSGTYVPPDEFRSVAGGVLAAWRERRGELQAEIERRRKALEAARSRHPAVGLVRREAADDVVTATRDAFDPRNGGFGGEPKFPHGEAIEMLFVLGQRTRNPDWLEMAERTLDGMLAGELWDDVDGGFFRYTTAADWTGPHYEKMLEVNAGLLRAYALGAQLRGRADWRRTAERVVDWVERVLRLPEGLWGGSQDADEDYYRLEARARRKHARPTVDAVVYANWNAQWIAALAEAGGRLAREDWIGRAGAALDTLLAAMSAPDGLLYHHREPDDEPALSGLLTDAVEAMRAGLAVAQTTGRADALARVGTLAEALERLLWAEDGGFIDHRPSEDDVGALRYRDRPFELNAHAARALLDLTEATGERGYHAVAERILAVLSPLAGRYGVAGGAFALAVDEFFEPPLRIVVVGPREQTKPLRSAALALPDPERRVWTLERGGRLGALNFPAGGAPAAYACGLRSCSPPVRDPAELAAAVNAIR